MDKIKGGVITNIKMAINAFVQIQKQRKKNSGKVGQTKELPFLVCGGFYNTMEGCVLSQFPKAVRKQAERAFDELPSEIKHSLQFSPKKGEFIVRAKLWKSILRPVMPPNSTTWPWVAFFTGMPILNRMIGRIGDV